MIRFLKKQVLLTFCSLVLLYGCLCLKESMLVYKTAQNQTISTVACSKKEPTLRKLKEMNSDVVGLLVLEDTSIRFPFVQGEDDLEYCYKDVYGNKAVCGSIYLSVQNQKDFSDEVNLMYGHNMEKSMMFGCLFSYLDETYFKNHTCGELVLETHSDPLEVIGILEASCYEETLYNVKNQSVSTILSYCNERFIHYNNVEHVDKLILCSTCMDYQSDDRLILILGLRGDDRGTNPTTNQEYEV